MPMPDEVAVKRGNPHHKSGLVDRHRGTVPPLTADDVTRSLGDALDAAVGEAYWLAKTDAPAVALLCQLVDIIADPDTADTPRVKAMQSVLAMIKELGFSPSARSGMGLALVAEEAAENVSKLEKARRAA